MAKKTRKVLSLCLALILCVSLAATTVSADWGSSNYE